MADRSDNTESKQPNVLPVHSGHVDSRFELLQVVGSGSSGTVYRAKLKATYKGLSTGTEVAIKFLRPELLANEKARARLFSEGQLGQSLHHTNVAEIYGVETVTLLGVETTYLVMQFVSGTTLREMLQRSGSPVEDLARRLGADAARGLFALHRRELAHRDVKPENLILTPSSELKIVDLGLARPFGSEGGGSSPSNTSGNSAGRSSGFGLAGSVAYTAPEILRGEPSGPRCDLYALGVVLFEVTTGQHPFANTTTPDEMMHAHLFDSPPQPSHLRPRISPFLEQVLLDLLQKDPDQRPRSAAELARILEQGERSDFWQKHEMQAPVLASSRRLLRMRRPAEAPFVGRRTESARLDAALASARSGKGSVIAVVAPGSTGRRRLLDEVMQRWLEGEAPPRYLGGNADSGLGHGEPFASTLLDLLLRGDSRHSPNARARATAHALERFHHDAPNAEALVACAFGDSTEPTEVRADRLANAFLQLPEKDRSLVVRIDHADELDSSGRLVLQQLANAAVSHHLLVLLVVGPDAKITAPHDRMELSGLDARSFATFGRSLFRPPIAAGVITFLSDAHQMLSGLPGSLLEALDHLVENGELLGRVGDYHQLNDNAEARPAPSHVERFRDRVQSLDPSQRAVLSAAAVLGDRCSLEELSALILKPELAVLETLSLFRGRIVRAQGGEVTFRHRHFRQALLRTMPADERQRLHTVAASVLEARGARPLVVGMHRSQALDHQGCIDPLLAALKSRVDAGSRRTSIRLVGRLSAHFKHIPETDENAHRRLQFLVLAGQTHETADQFDLASRSFQAAERLAHTLEDLNSSAAARIGLAACDIDSGRMLAAITLLETVHNDLSSKQSLPLPEATGALAAQAHELHGRILLYLGQSADCMKHLLAAKKRVPDQQDDLRCHLWIDLARAESLAHRYATALRTLKAIEQAHAVRHLPRSRLRFHLYRGQVRMLLGDPQASDDLHLALDEADHWALPVYGARAAVLLGERDSWLGRDTDARSHFEQALTLSKSANDRLAEALARSHLLRLGAEDPELQLLVEALDLPELQANWLLAMAKRNRAVKGSEKQLESLIQNADLPLPLHLRVLQQVDRPASGRALVRSVSERLPQRAMRQRFLAYWQDPPRL